MPILIHAIRTSLEEAPSAAIAKAKYPLARTAQPLLPVLPSRHPVRGSAGGIHFAQAADPQTSLPGRIRVSISLEGGEASAAARVPGNRAVWTEDKPLEEPRMPPVHAEPSRILDHRSGWSASRLRRCPRPLPQTLRPNHFR